MVAKRDTILHGMDMTIGDLVPSSGMSRERYLANLGLSTYWGGEVELYLLAITRKQIIHLYLDATNDCQ